MNSEQTVKVVSALLGAVAAVAPGVLAAITSTASDEEAIDAAIERVRQLPERRQAWAEDLARRERGEG